MRSWRERSSWRKFLMSLYACWECIIPRGPFVNRTLHIVLCETNYYAHLPSCSPTAFSTRRLRLHVHHTSTEPLADSPEPLTASAKRIGKQVVPRRAFFLRSLDSPHRLVLLRTHRTFDLFLLARTDVQAALMERMLAHEMHSRQIKRHAAASTLR